MRDFTHDLSALALNTATLGHNVPGAGAGWSPERTLDACARRGIGGIVFWRREVTGRGAEIARRAREAGVSVAGLCRSPFLVGPMAPVGRQAVIDDFRSALDLAAELGAPILTIVTGGVQPETKGVEESLKLVAGYLEEVVPYADACGVKLALEPLNPAYGGDRSCLTTTRDALDICDLVNAPGLGVAIDVYHVWWDTDLRYQLQRAGHRILGYHLCDWLAQTTDILLDRGMMGDGVADLKPIRAAVEAAGYSGFCEVEIFSVNNWWKRNPDDVLDIMIDRFRTVC
ncbi:sugar phosphate isomerase/epimerase family protein [Acetobacter senegalensis]|uniref:sugar phosphate isomerase/epimerase family protein n=1 Tax=Acetobacter senegalensis TaxID=446692 RepID=UPI00128C9D80|nr:sugar phosphate isomerase/epimerase family protein [Acetobacter senegalensis]MCG4258369.1 sugar phosphate isomerase/epimerase [Acetobacter senegalensis]MCG4268295.1 sugar phosphate isomerase/epimerase [Acetobacter senegalensis]MPQ72912.1 TIM barrel protein [Acetobacter senegalensis]